MEKTYYWDLLQQVTKLEKEMFAHNVPSQLETINLKTLAFCGLIRLGETFQIESNAAEIARLEAEKQKKIIGSSNIQIPELTELIRIKHMDNTVYSMELSILKDMMKSDYDRYIAGVSQQEAEADYDELDIELPDIFSDQDPLPEADVPTPTAESSNTPAKKPSGNGKRNEDYEPQLIGDINYNHDIEHTKSLDTFCVNVVRLVYQEDDKRAVVDFNIYPLTFRENEPATDIFVTAKSGAIVRAGISRGTSTAVRIDFDELSFMARGLWRDGAFKTQVNCLSKDYADKFVQDTIEYMPTNRTYSTYMQEEFNHITYSFFPSIIGKNSRSGNVPTAMVFKHNGLLQVILSNEKEAFNMVDEDGLPFEIFLYWSGGKNPKLKLQVDEE